MNLCELLNITYENCFLILPNSREQERIKKLELANHKTTLHFDIAMEYEGALAGMLKEDRKEIIKSFNLVELLIVYIHTITWNYNSIANVMAQYCDNKKLLYYHIEMIKLFVFFKEPFCKLIVNNPNGHELIKQAVDNHRVDKDSLKDIQLFPRFGMMCENKIELYKNLNYFNAVEAQINLWNNSSDE